MNQLTERIRAKTFEQIYAPERQWYPSETILQLGGMAMKVSQIERVPRYPDGHRENDAEHSYMLSLLAPELAEMLYPDVLNSGLVAQFANVHEFDETIMNDMATFKVTDQQLEAKKAAENAITAQVAATLPPYTRDLYLRYKAQEEPEAIFVCQFDKILPVVSDILGDGIRVMREDYDVHDPVDLKACHDVLRQRMAARFPQFPELLPVYKLLTDMFQAQFTAAVSPERTPAYLD